MVESKSKYEEIKNMNTRELQDMPARVKNTGEGGRVQFEFSIGGMTCVNCAEAINKKVRSAFTDKGLIEVKTTVMTEKSKITFDKDLMNSKLVTQDMVRDTVAATGKVVRYMNVTQMKADKRNTKKIDIDDIDLNNDDSIISSKRGSENGFIMDKNAMQNAPTEKQAFIKLENQQSVDQADKTMKFLTPKVEKIDGVQLVERDPNCHENFRITYSTQHTKLRDVLKSIKEQGCSCSLVNQNEDNDIRVILQESVDHFRNKFLLSLSFLMPILLLTWVIPYVYGNFLVSIPILWGNTLYVFLVTLFATIIQFYIGASFYKGAYMSLQNRSANMDVLVVLGTTAAWFYGIILIFLGHETRKEGRVFNYQATKLSIHEHVHNFEIASVLITVILLGKFLESFSKKQTVDKLSQLASLKVSQAQLVIGVEKQEQLSLNCQVEEIQVELLAVGDFIKVTNGQSIPIDGVVVLGNGTCNESMLTGESRPVLKEYGVKVYGGTLLTKGSLIVKVEKLAENATINQIMSLVEEAQSNQAPIQGIADKISNVFVPTIILLSVLTWIFWFSYAYSAKGKETIELGSQTRFFFAFAFGISTLVIACPCALGLATPTAVMVGTGVAANFGVLIKGGDVFEKISAITTVVFDKTGTLTSGQPKVVDMIMLGKKFKVPDAITDENLLKNLAYLCETCSEHPIGKAIVKHIDARDSSERFKVQKFKNKNGEGITATIEDLQEQITYEVLCGNDKLMKRHNVKTDYGFGQLQENLESLEEQGKTVIMLAVNKLPVYILTLEEEHLAKQEAKQVVEYLRDQLGFRICMITGDNKHSAYKVGRYLGIAEENITSRAYPHEKRSVVMNYQEQGEKVMFIGDGVNDSPVLAKADVGVAINSASDITVNAADIVLMKDKLDDVLNAILVSQATFRRIKYNFMWAFVYNVILVPIAMGVLYPAGGFRLDPMWAGAAMALSSVSVVLSSLMLKCFTPKQFDYTTQIQNTTKSKQQVDDLELAPLKKTQINDKQSQELSQVLINEQ